MIDVREPVSRAPGQCSTVIRHGSVEEVWKTYDERRLP